MGLSKQEFEQIRIMKNNSVNSVQIYGLPQNRFQFSNQNLAFVTVQITENSSYMYLNESHKSDDNLVVCTIVSAQVSP